MSIMLGSIGSFMFIESLNALRRSKVQVGENAHPHEPKESSVRKLAAKLPLQMHFEKSRMSTSAIFPFVLGTAVGILAAIMGVGGGFIMVPSMIYILGMPTIVAIGTDLFQIVLTCINVTVQQAIRNHTVDLILVILLFYRIHDRGSSRSEGQPAFAGGAITYPSGRHCLNRHGQNVD